MKYKRAHKATVFIVVALILALTLTAFLGLDNYYGDKRNIYIKGARDIRWGIDISGGVEAVFSPDKADTDITAADMEAAKSIIETRLVNKNITDYEVYNDTANHQVIVRFPWKANESSFDPAATVKELGATAQLYFYNGDDNSGNAFMTGDVVKSATAGYDAQYGYLVSLVFNESGKSAFASATAAAHKAGTNISIYLDTQQISVASCENGAITNGEAIIYGSKSTMTAEYVQDLAEKINAGSLPFALTADNSKLQIVSPSLGSNALFVMVIAGAAAFAIICLIMILRYRVLGGVAAIALLGQLAGMIACISGYLPTINSFTLTVPGIAGIILSIGVGVDANVIAFERIKEEFKKGKSVTAAIDSGYKNSLSAIIDGNVTIVIVSVVLMGAFGAPDSILSKIFSPIMSIFGTSITGAIYSFGYTLLIGVIFNLIMGVLASKAMARSLVQFKGMQSIKLYGGAK